MRAPSEEDSLPLSSDRPKLCCPHYRNLQGCERASKSLTLFGSLAQASPVRVLFCAPPGGYVVNRTALMGVRLKPSSEVTG